MKILLTGANGMLGRDVMAEMAPLFQVLPYPREVLDITDRAQVDAAVATVQPDVIINTAAYTNVDACESDLAGCMAVNGGGPGVLAQAARSCSALLVHYSTDYVFDGRNRAKPWREDDATAPLNAYGRSKLAGEEAIRASGARHLILRTAWLYGLHGNNFVTTMQHFGRERDRLTVVDDQIGSPTGTVELAQMTRALLAAGASGVVHATAAGACSWHGFAVEIMRLSGLGTPVDRVDSRGFVRPAARPAYSVLSGERLRGWGVTPQPWQRGLARFIASQSK